MTSTGPVTPNNVAYAYDTSPSTFSAVTSQTAIESTQTYSGMPSSTPISGTLTVVANILLNDVSDLVGGTTGLSGFTIDASIYYSIDGSTPTLSFDQTSSWSATFITDPSGVSYTATLTKTFTTPINPANIKVCCSQKGYENTRLFFLKTVEMDIYDIIFNG